VARLIRHLPAAAATVWIILAKLTGFTSVQARLIAFLLTAAGVYSLRQLAARNEASPVHKGMVLFTAAASVSVWIGPHFDWPAHYPVAALYAVLFLVAVLPPLLGREVFTTYFAQKITPPAVWKTDIFIAVNRRLTALWATLFAAGFSSALIPGFFQYRGFLWETLFEALVPAALMLGIGIPANKRYPDYYQRKLGLVPATDTGPGSVLEREASSESSTRTTFFQKEKQTMESRYTVVAVNGSPHAGAGNTALMLAMVGDALNRLGCKLDVIHLTDHVIEYCIGCGFCMENGKCWMPDDHAAILDQILAADAVILASPVYFFHVTAQMKTFLDRSLALGHKPRPTWKPGLAVSVSAGSGETQVADYLAGMLRVYGAFPVGCLTALSTVPGGFLGKDAVEARAADLAGDLARAISEKRRYPATEMDLRYYHFMSVLVRENRDSVMKNDFDHWEQLGLNQGFEAYIQQKREATAPRDPEVRKAWMKELMADYAKKRSIRETRKSRPSTDGASLAKTCRELLQTMPSIFDRSEASGLSTTYEFQVSGEEVFNAHLKIEAGTCTYGDGPADSPGVVIKTPASVWLAISRGELDGQTAFMNGKFTVEGDLTLLFKMKKLFR
jgi:multimeric flavodoxin WrbA/putative sterol carrier protein